MSGQSEIATLISGRYIEIPVYSLGFDEFLLFRESSRQNPDSPLLKTAHELCGELTYIFNRLISKDKAKKEIGIWSEPVRLFGTDCSETFLSTSERRIEEISNYFIGLQTGGSVEGLNNRIRVIKRRCYGIFNVRHLFQRIFIDIEGYSLFGCHGEI